MTKKVDKYKEGDIIIVKDKLYLCDIAGAEKSVFKRMTVSVIGGGFCKSNTDTVTIPSQMERTRKKRKLVREGERNTMIKHPVVGRAVRQCCCYEVMWNLTTLASNLTVLTQFRNMMTDKIDTTQRRIDEKKRQKKKAKKLLKKMKKEDK